jgi:putative ABC transport system substrate-binding protein
MTRREFMTLVGGTVATWPLAARAQQATMPVVGFLSSASPTAWTSVVAGFREGLNETGFIDGQNVTIEFRWAEGQYDRLPELAHDLVARHAALIFAAGGSDPARAAMAATGTIPIVFVSAADPLKAGLGASLNRPGGNVTGVSLIGAALEAKRLELLRELTPKVGTFAALINPNYPAAKTQSEELQEAAAHFGLKLIMLNASTEGEIDIAFARLVALGAGALLVSQDPFFNSKRDQLVALAARFSVPTIFSQREAAVNGGLVSYGPSFADGFRQAGIYIGKILKGARPADLPILQPTKFELIINLNTAKALGLIVPLTLQASADEVIE